MNWTPEGAGETEKFSTEEEEAETTTKWQGRRQQVKPQALLIVDTAHP